MKTDRELWRERPDDYYAASIHVTERGGIGINVAGYVIVMPLREWHRLAKSTPPAPVTPGQVSALRAAFCHGADWATPRAMTLEDDREATEAAFLCYPVPPVAPPEGTPTPCTDDECSYCKAGEPCHPECPVCHRVAPPEGGVDETRLHRVRQMLAPHRGTGCPMTGEQDCCDSLVVEERLLTRLVALESRLAARERAQAELGDELVKARRDTALLDAMERLRLTVEPPNAKHWIAYSYPQATADIINRSIGHSPREAISRAATLAGSPTETEK